MNIAMFSKPTKALTASDAYYSILAARQDAYSEALAAGHYSPFVYPWDALGASLLFLAILVLPRIPVGYRTPAKTATAIWILYFGLQTMFKARCLGFANGYGIGLTFAWTMIITVVLLFCNDVESDFKRLEWRDVPDEERLHPNGSVNGSATASEVLHGAGPTKRRVYGVDGPAVSVDVGNPARSVTKPYVLIWQSFPSSILHCVEWTADLMTTFRGVGWNWRIPTCPPFDIPVQDPEGKLQPRNTASASIATSTSVSLPTVRQLQLTALRDFVAHYLILDLLKTIMITDPYFMGISDISSPSPWPFLRSLGTPTTAMSLLIRFTRLVISICGVLSALTFIFSLSPLFFIGILTTLIPSQYIRRITRSPILEPSLYPPYWQSTATVANGGLAALWSKSWHQLFRFGLSEPSRALTQYFGLDKRSQPARLLQLGVAFALSGFIHASASFTTFSVSKPLTGPFIFFVLQGVGIVLQQQATVVAKNHLYFAYRLPIIQKMSNVVFVLGWLFLTGPFVANDFARCGVWLFEPIPVSLLRGIIWDDWWAWKNMTAWIGWYGGATWYKSGLAIY